MTRFGILALALVLTSSCGRSFDALAPDGMIDGSVADAASCSADACALEPDAGVGVDGGVDAGASECLPGGWLPPMTALPVEASATVPVRADDDGTTFFLTFLNGNPSPCDGACPVVMEATTRVDGESEVLELSGVMPAYWTSSVVSERLDVRKAGSSSAALITAVGASQVAWQWRPLRREGWQSDGTFDFSDPIFDARRVADVAPLGDHALPSRSSRVAIVHLPESPDEDGYFDDLQLIAIDEGGSAVTYRDLFPVDGVRAPRVVEGTSWIAAIQGWDFPPTVQLVQVDGVSDIAGGSCDDPPPAGGLTSSGVASFDVAPTSDGFVAVVQDCADRSEIGGAIEVELRGGASGRVVVSQRRSFVPSRAAILPATESYAEGIAVAFVEQGADSPTLAIVHRTAEGLELRESMRLPVSEAVRLPITAVDVVARDDRTVLVTWTGTPIDPDDLWAWEGPEAAFTLVQRCPCADALCI